MLETVSLSTNSSLSQDSSQEKVTESNIQPQKVNLRRNLSEIRSSQYTDDMNVYSEPFEMYNGAHQRSLSNVSSPLSKPDLEFGKISPSLKKVANLPITTGTTKLLQSIQQTNLNPYMTLPKEFNKDEIKLKIQNDYTPTPTHQRSPNVLKTLPKPSKSKPTSQSLHKKQHNHHKLRQQLSALPLSELPPQSYNTLPSPSKIRSLPPAPPKRDQSTKLSSHNHPYNTINNRRTYDNNTHNNRYDNINDNNNNYNTYIRSSSHYDTPTIHPNSKKTHNFIQTQNFLLNMNRALGQKRSLGVDGIIKMETPLSPPPSFPSTEGSYLDTGTLPPPPAELLYELKHMESNNQCNNMDTNNQYNHQSIYQRVENY